MASTHSNTKPDYVTYFSDPALIKAYYIPTENLQLTEEQRKMAMSPHRIPERESGDKQPITPETEAYLRQAEYVYNTEKGMPDHPTPSPPSTVKFDESWPSTEHPSTLGSNLTKQSNGVENHSPSTDDSIISKYLRRFRNDPPLKREERQVPSLHEFWWGPNSGYSSKSGGSSVTKTDAVDKSSSKSSGSSVRATENTNSDRDFEVSSNATPRSHSSHHKTGKRINFEATTPKTKVLMDRTNQLLSNSELTGTSSSPPTFSTGPQVSSDDSSGGHIGVYHSTPEEDAVRPVLHRASQRSASDGPIHKHSASLNPENDILYQWRLKRRLEQAQERVKAAEHQAAFSNPGVGRYSNLSAAMPRPIIRSATSTAAPSSPVAPTYGVGHGGASGDAGTVRSVKTTVVERVIQTDAEIVQAATQTTPTVDPISACTGSVADIQTCALRDRISAASPTKPCPHCCRNYDPSSRPQYCNRRCQPYADCDRQAAEIHQPIESSRKLCTGCKQPLPGANVNNNCVDESSSDTNSTCATSVSNTPISRPRRAVKAPPIPRTTADTKTTCGTTPVSKAISEVCKQRLFDCSLSPDTTLTSPIGPVPGSTRITADSKGQASADECADTVSSAHAVSSADTASSDRSSSDGEYSDDELLAALRAKRQQLMESMRRVETKLCEVAIEPL